MDRRTKIDGFLEITSWILLLITFGIAIYEMQVLPDTIASHFNTADQADGYGSPATLLVLPIIMAFQILVKKNTKIQKK